MFCRAVPPAHACHAAESWAWGLGVEGLRGLGVEGSGVWGLGGRCRGLERLGVLAVSEAFLWERCTFSARLGGPVGGMEEWSYLAYR